MAQFSNRQRILLPAWLLVILSQTVLAPAQCEMCRAALADSLEGRQMAGAFNHGILFLLGAPFLIVGVIALMIVREHRSGKR